MTDVHSCSYYCDRPECIKAQRDELRDRLAQSEQEPVRELTDEKIVSLWRQHKEVMGFAKALLAVEREACAHLCESEGLLWGRRYATFIRARGQA